MVTASDRIAALRARVLERKDADDLGYRRWSTVARADSLRATEGMASWQIRRGRQTAAVLRAIPFEMDDLELLAGRMTHADHGVTEAAYRDANDYLKGYPPAHGQTGHCELNLQPVMEAGLEGLRREIEGRLAASEGESAEAYESFLEALAGLSDMIRNAAAVTEAARAGAGPERRAELDAIAASCRRIAHDPPQSFRDAIQLVWSAIFGVMHGESVGLVVPGHLDRILAPFYEADTAQGLLSSEEALVLIENLYLLINDYIPDGLAMSVMVGGRDAAGRDMTNDLSFLSLEALRRTRLIYPTVGICWHPGTPGALCELATDLIGKGNPNPAFFGDEVIQRGLRGLGVPADESHHYINSTCVEITPARSSNVWVASPYFSMCRMLNEEIAGQVGTGTLAPDFIAFRERYQARVAQAVADAVADENRTRADRRAYGRKPLQSVFTRDCIERGRDIDDGGARYNWVECSFVGLANLADSLHVIREEVFETKRMSLPDLKAVLDANFEGHEEARLRFLQGYPKYGQDCPEVDALFGETIAFVRDECARHAMEPDGSPFVPGAFCWVMHERLGAVCGATPDGRRAGEAFADGCGPAQGREACGPTAAILSTTSWDHSPMIGGLAFNMKFSRALFDAPEGFARLGDLVQTFLQRGGFETQINVVDAGMLREARAHPEAYRDLVVRIGGYCDYFTRLSPEMQDEVILRTEYSYA